MWPLSGLGKWWKSSVPPGRPADLGYIGRRDGRHTDREMAEGQASRGMAPALLAAGFPEMPSYVSGYGRVPVATRDTDTFSYGAKKLNSG